MKKIFIIAIVFLGTSAVAEAQSAPATSKTITVAEAMQGKPVTEPKINGIPYNQYKVQMQAKQQATEAAKKVPSANNNAGLDGITYASQINKAIFKKGSYKPTEMSIAKKAEDKKKRETMLKTKKEAAKNRTKE